MRNKRWSSGVIRDQSAENLVLIWILTLAWNVVTALALIPHIKDGIHGHDRARLIALIFPMIGLGLLLWAARRTRRLTKFGPSVFHLQTLPATPGGDLAGTIHVTRKLQSESPIQLRLVCIIRFVAGFGRHARVVDRIIWQEAQTLDRLPSCEDGTDIPVLFHIPPDAQPSSDLDLRDGVRWKLEARCKTPGVAYYSRFEVPVFVVAPSKFPVASARNLIPSSLPAEPLDPRSNLSERGIVFERIAAGRLQIHFAAARNKSFVMFTAAIGLALSAIAIGLFAWPAASRMDRVIAISFASSILLFGGVFDFIAIFNWLVTDEITVRYGSLTVERRAPLFHRQRTFKVADVADVFHRLEGSSSSAAETGKVKEKRFHSLMLKTRDGDLFRLANDIIQNDYAAWLADEIKDTFGVVTRK